MQLVELFGPPGVGKSTLARQVAHRPRGLPPSGLAPVGPYRAAYQVLRDHVTDRLRPRLAFTARLLAGVERIVARVGSGRWLLEEGSAQRAHVLVVLAVPTWQIFVEALPVESLTVCLCTATPEVIAYRGVHRGRHGLTLAQAPKSVAACTWTADTLEHRGARVHRFDMELPVAENAARLAEVLRV